MEIRLAGTILDRWDITAEELTLVVDQNPSLRGMVLGYVAELKLERLWLDRPGITDVVKPDDHDRRRKGDRVVYYKGRKFTFESKSLQTKTVQPTEDGWIGKAQVDASDRRLVSLPDGSEIPTTCLLRRFRHPCRERVRVLPGMAIRLCQKYGSTNILISRLYRLSA